MAEHFEEVQPTLPVVAAKFGLSHSEDVPTVSVLTKTGLQEVVIQTMDPVKGFFIPIPDASIVQRMGDKVMVVFQTSPETVSSWQLKNCKMHVLVALRDRFCVLDLNLKLIREIEVRAETCKVFAVCPSTGRLAYPTSKEEGIVALTTATSEDQDVCVELEAHNSPIAALAFSSDGRYLASASQKGTVIRVFCGLTGNKVTEFRRGLQRTVEVTSLTFSHNDEFLVLASDKETVHIFKMGSAPTQTWMGYFGGLVASGLEAGIGMFGWAKTYCEQERAFARAHLPCLGDKQVSTIVDIMGKPRLVVTNLARDLFVFDLPPATASTANDATNDLCQLILHHKISDVPEEERDDTITLINQSSAAGLSVTLTPSSGLSVGNYSGWERGLRQNPKPYASSARPTDASGAEAEADLTTCFPFLEQL